MAEEISNRTLAILLILAIAISLGGTIISLNRFTQVNMITGLAGSSTGSARVNVTSTASLRFVKNATNFGDGSVNTSAGNQYCRLTAEELIDYNGTAATCIGFNTSREELEIENDGNTLLNVTLASAKTPAQFIGGTTPEFMWKVDANESLVCDGSIAPADWTTVSTTDLQICPKLDFQNGNDSLDVHFNITIPYNSLTGVQTVTLTATGTATT